MAAAAHTPSVGVCACCCCLREKKNPGLKKHPHVAPPSCAHHCPLPPRANYTVVFGGVVVFSILTSPMLLIAIAIFGALWVWLLSVRPRLGRSLLPLQLASAPSPPSVCVSVCLVAPLLSSLSFGSSLHLPSSLILRPCSHVCFSSFPSLAPLSPFSQQPHSRPHLTLPPPPSLASWP